MRRSAWFAAGAAAGAYGVVRVRRLVEAFTVDGMRDRVGAVFVGARMFRAEFAQGAADAETDLRERYRRAATERRLALGQGLDTPSPSDTGYSTSLERHSTNERDNA